jgi:hypothetical protein
MTNSPTARVLMSLLPSRSPPGPRDLGNPEGEIHRVSPAFGQPSGLYIHVTWISGQIAEPT